MKVKISGSALIEVLMASAILMVILVPVLNLFATSLETSWFATRELRAQALLQESLEAVRSVRERDWLELADGPIRVESVDGQWQIAESESGEVIGPFLRQIEISPVYREADGEIVESGGQLDLSTKSMVSSVSWHSLRDRTLSFQTYLTRYLENLIWTQTTQAEFDLGEKQLTETTLTADGEVVLMGGCGTNPVGAAIYDDQFQNTWQIHPSAKDNISEVNQPPGQVYEGTRSLELRLVAGADTKLRNVQNVCTLGFTNLQFYVYNSAAVEQSFSITGQWSGLWVTIVVPPQEWTFFSIPYADVSQGEEVNLSFIFFRPENMQTGTLFYVDNIALTGGVGGYYTQGTLTSSVFDAGRETVFNRVGFQAALPSQTAVGLQLATSLSASGPWLFYGPGGTTAASDLYTDPAGEGIWLGNNQGRYVRYKAYLESFDGESTPILESVNVNYAP